MDTGVQQGGLIQERASCRALVLEILGFSSPGLSSGSHGVPIVIVSTYCMFRKGFSFRKGYISLSFRSAWKNTTKLRKLKKGPLSSGEKRELKLLELNFGIDQNFDFVEEF